MTKSNYIYGIHPVIEAIKAGKDIDKVLVQKNAKVDTTGELWELIKQCEIPIQYVPIEKLNKITMKNHQGIICFISEVPYQNVEQILPIIYEKGEVPLILILDRISDVRNLGASSRTAECAGAHAIVVPEKGSAQINSETVKASAGAIFNVPICRSSNLKHTVTFLRESGLHVVACTEKGNTEYFKTDYTSPVAIIMGSEEDGISDDLIRIADCLATIPLHGDIGSLNVSVASGVILYETVRQRS